MDNKSTHDWSINLIYSQECLICTIQNTDESYFTCLKIKKT